MVNKSKGAKEENLVRWVLRKALTHKNITKGFKSSGI